MKVCLLACENVAFHTSQVVRVKLLMKEMCTMGNEVKKYWLQPQRACKADRVDLEGMILSGFLLMFQNEIFLCSVAPC